MFFTMQPGGAYIETPGPVKGAWLVYPNMNHSRAGKRVQFFNYRVTGSRYRPEL